MIIAQEESIVHNAMLENNKINALLASAMECYEMVKQNRPPAGTREKIKSLQYYGESLNPHEIKRLNDESSNKDYRIATENFISKAIDSSMRVIKTIIDAIISAIKKIIEWVSSLFGGGGNSNESKNKKVENEIKEAKDKKEEKPTISHQSPSVTPAPAVTPIQTLIDENKANIGPDKSNPYIIYHLFGNGEFETADPSSTLPYFARNEDIGYGFEGAVIVDYARICSALVSSARYVDKYVEDDDDIREARNHMIVEYQERGRLGLYGADSCQPWDLHKTSYFKSDHVCYNLLYMNSRIVSNNSYAMIPSSLGIDYITIQIHNFINRLDSKNPVMSMDDYLITDNEDAHNEIHREVFIGKHWNNNYTKLDDLIRNNYDEADKIFKQSSKNINDMLKAYREILKEMPNKEDMDKLYSKSVAGSGFQPYDVVQCRNNYVTSCLNIVFACIKQISYEMRATQRLSDQARSLGRYIANRRIQMNSETN